MKAAVYVRVSTEQQGGDDHASLATQRAACERYAEQHDMDVVRSYQDVDSGTNAKRAHYQRMIADALAGEFEAIVVYNSSRWGRNASESMASYEVLENAGVIVHSTMGDMGDFVTRVVHSGMNEEHSRRLSLVVRSNMSKKAEQGDSPGSKVAFGYRRERDERGKPKGVVIDEETGPMMRRIFEAAANGATFAKCAAMLRELGHPVNEASVKGMLSNEFYRGKVRWLDPSVHLPFKAAQAARKQGKRQRHVYQGNHPALIDEALWARTQDAIQRRMFKLRRANKGLAAGLVACGYCGEGAVWHQTSWRRRKDGEFTGEVNHYSYYLCGPRHGKPKVTPDCKWWVRSERIDNWLRAQLRTIVVRPDSIDRMAALLDAQRDEILNKHAAERKAIEHNLRTLRERDTKLLNAMLDETISKAEYGKRHAEFERAIEQAEADLTELRPAQLPDYAAFISNLRQLPATLAKGDNAKLRPLLRGMGLRIDVRGKTDIRLVGFVEGLL